MYHSLHKQASKREPPDAKPFPGESLKASLVSQPVPVLVMDSVALAKLKPALEIWFAAY